MGRKRIFKDVIIDTLPLYNVWALMKQRCINPKQQSFKYYGANGVKVCPSWQKFMPFYKWAMKRGYTKGMEVSRYNDTGNYSPKNCKLSTHLQNCREKRNTTNITYNGQTHSISEWSEKLKVSRYQVKKLFNIPRNKKTA